MIRPTANDVYVNFHFLNSETLAWTHYDLMQVVEKVGTVARVDLGRLEAWQTIERGRGPFPDTPVMAVQCASARVDAGVCGTMNEKIIVRPRFDTNLEIVLTGQDAIA